MNQETVELRAADFAVPPDSPRWQGRALIVGIVGIAFCIAAAIFDLQDFLRGYLIAFMFWTGLSLGCLGLLMVQYLSGGLWGLVDPPHSGGVDQVPAADGSCCFCPSCSCAITCMRG